MFSRGNLKRWSELVAKRKQEHEEQTANKAIEANDEKLEADAEKTDQDENEDNNNDLNEVAREIDKMKSAVEIIKSEALEDISFSSDDE